MNHIVYNKVLLLRLFNLQLSDLRLLRSTSFVQHQRNCRTLFTNNMKYELEGNTPTSRKYNRYLYIRLLSSSSPFDPDNQKMLSSLSTTTTKKRKPRRTFIPRIAAVQLTDQARKFFKVLIQDQLEKQSDIIGVMLNCSQSSSGEPRMVYKFSFVTSKDIDIEQDEGVSLEVITTTDKDGKTIITVPKSPIDSRNDNLPKLYIHHNAFLKVLGATIDIDMNTYTPILYDKEGNRMDPNA